MKKRFKNIATTIIGLFVALSATSVYFWGDLIALTLGYEESFSISVLEYATLLILSWVFVSAKDTLLEGLFFKLFKIKSTE